MAEIIENLQCRDCCFKQDVFKILNEEELEVMNNGRYEIKYKAGETIFKQGAALTHIACITGGKAKVFLEGLNGRNLIIRIVKAGDMIGGPGIYTDYRHHFTVSALTETSICQIEVESFNQVVEMNSKFALEILKKTNIMGIHHFNKFIELTQKHMPGRIADAIIYLSEGIHKKLTFDTAISRQDLAEMTAMTKESAIRILKDFKDAGILTVDGQHFEILNMEALKNISRTG